MGETVIDNQPIKQHEVSIVLLEPSLSNHQDIFVNMGGNQANGIF
jgi:hypothetical protein